MLRRPGAGGVQLSYDELIREALCWGWIDGQSRPLDERRSMLWMTHRRPGQPVVGEQQGPRGRPRTRGSPCSPPESPEIERARANGMWTIYDSVDALQEPAALTVALDADPRARATWDAYPRRR